MRLPRECPRCWPSAGRLGATLLSGPQTLNSRSPRYDIEARVPDTDRDLLGADTSSAASFGAASLLASGSARLFGPEGVRRSRRVRGEGPRVSGERPRVMPQALQSAITCGGRLTAPAPHHGCEGTPPKLRNPLRILFLVARPQVLV